MNKNHALPVALALFSATLLLFQTSCKKTETGPQNYFSAKGMSLVPNQWDTAAGGHQIDADVFAGSNFQDRISFYFYSPYIPPAGSYNAIYQYPSQVLPNGVSVSLTLQDSISYALAPSNRQKVTVSQNQNGKLVISGTNIEMINFYNPSDSLPLTFCVTQP